MSRSDHPGAAGSRTGTRVDADAAEVRRASATIGRQVTVAAAVLVLGIVAVALVFIRHQSLPGEQLRNAADPSAIFVDTSDVVTGLVLAGLAAVVLAGGVARLVAHRAVRPLGRALQVQRDFVADASHELRTPLTVLDARVQVLQRRLRRLEELAPSDHGRTTALAGVAEAATQLRADSQALVHVVDDLLAAAAGDEPYAGPPVDAGTVAREAVASLQVLAGAHGVGIHVDAPHDVRVLVPEAALRRCVVALVDNALTHSPAGSEVAVRLERNGTRLGLHVADQGPGLQGIDADRVFDRFARAPGTATGYRGHGIGLALVREIATRHGGRVRVAHSSAAGTEMVLELPLAD